MRDSLAALLARRALTPDATAFDISAAAALDPMMFDPEQSRAAIRVLHALAQELTGQEQLLAEQYRQTLADPAFDAIARHASDSSAADDSAG